MLCASIASRAGGPRRSRVSAAGHRALLPHRRAIARHVGVVGARQQHGAAGAELSQDRRAGQSARAQGAAGERAQTGARLAAGREERAVAVGGGQR